MSHISSLIGQHFAFAHGRLGTLKQLLLSQTDVDRLLGAASFRETEKILTELKLTSVVDQGISSGDDMLDAIGVWMRTEVGSMIPEKKADLLSILWCDGDAPELAYLLKKKAGLTSSISTQPVSFLSAYPQAALAALVETGESDSVPAYIVDFVTSTENDDIESAEKIDAVVAQLFTDEKIRLAKKSGSKDLLTFVTHQIDLKNIRTALRMSSLEPEKRALHLLSGGTISTAELNGSRDELVAAVERSEIGFHLPAVADLADSAVAFEQAAARVTASDIAHLWNIPLSLEPVFAFAAITVSQLRLLRAILIAKRNELAPQEIKKIQPPFIPATHYVS